MDAYVTANGVPAIRANIVRPRIGAWHADLAVDAQAADAFTGAVAIRVAESLTFQGFARRAGIHHDTVFVRVVGGAGGLTTALQPRSWQNVPLRIPLADCLVGSGETLSPSADAATLGTLLPKWVRPQRSAGNELQALLAAAKVAAWRVLPDGTIWVGPETWPTVTIDYQEIEFLPHLNRLEFGADVPAIAPGQVFTGASDDPYSGRKISSVEHVADAQGVRHRVFFEDAAVGVTDRIKAGLDAFVRSIFGPKIDALALYPSTVVSQNADGTLELHPDDPRWPGLSSVPVRLGIPGAKVKVAAGARVLVGFAGGDAQRPIAELWESGSVTELDLTATNIILNAGTAAVGRVGDAVAAAATMSTWVAAVHALLNGTGAASKGPLVAPTDFGTINAGAPGVKA